MNNSKFAHEEDGALLVFFAICAAAIFLVASLSFDLGQRASTQSELQSYADNVALAAAGELNGFANAIERAERAAANLISDDFVFGTKTNGETTRDLSGANEYDIYFYSELPADDATPLGIGTCDNIGTTNPLCKVPANDGRARYAHVIVKDVDVDWDFANLLSLFSNVGLPDEAVNADATAGYTSLACDVAPVFFCAPEDDEGNVSWNATDEIGNTILLKAGPQSGGQNGPTWTPGNFTWLNIVEQAVSVLDTATTIGPCQDFLKNTNGSFNPDLYECLFSAGTGTTCFANGSLETKPGGTEGVITAVFNTRFDIFGKGSGSNQSDALFAPAPVVSSGLVASSTCSSSTTPTQTTMGLPADDCFTGHGKGSCRSFPDTSTEVRFGNGNWSVGRLFYADVNYSFDAGSVGTPFTQTDINNPGTSSLLDAGAIVDPLNVLAAIQDELIEIGDDVYHRYDPMRPEGAFPKPAVYDGFPELEYGASQWEYYQAEVLVSFYLPDSVEGYAKYITEESDGSYTFSFSDAELRNAVDPDVNPVELINDIDLTIGGTDYDYDRLGASVPNCNANYGTTPRRRTIIAAVVDCSDGGPNEGVNGFTSDMIAMDYVEVFLLSPSGTMRNTVTGATPNNQNADKEIFVQVVSPSLINGEFTIDPGRFRNLVQLYR